MGFYRDKIESRFENVSHSFTGTKSNRYSKMSEGQKIYIYYVYISVRVPHRSRG